MEREPHDGAQSQIEHDPERTPSAGASTPGAGEQTVQPAPAVPTTGQPAGDSTTPNTSPPGVPAASPRQPAIAVPGKPDGEVDTRT